MFKTVRLAALVVGCLVPLVTPALAHGAAPGRPLTIPALQSFERQPGRWTLGSHARVVVSGRARASLRAEARELARDMRERLHRRVRVASGEARAGDVVLAAIRRRRRLGREGYELRIGSTFLIRAPTSTGVFSGGRTLLQLLHGGHPIPRGRALDWPRYPERGLMLDLGRRPYPLGWLKARVREMGDLKLNLLHLHLTDDQRWGIDSRSHPELVTPGALTSRQVRELLRLARRNHVEVVPEIDMPAHTGRILAAHPELALRDPAGAVPPSAWRDLDISNPAALRLVHDLLDEYLALFPGRYWHMGGDEYLTTSMYDDYPQLAAYATTHYGPAAGVQDAINGFFNWVDGIVRAHGEQLRAWSDQIGPGRAVQVNGDVLTEWWTGISPLSRGSTLSPADLLDAGHRVMNAGWFPTYYAEAGGAIEGRPGPAPAYETWEVNRFCSPRVAGAFILPCTTVGGGDVVGSKVNVWGNATTSLKRIALDLFPRLRVMAHKTWDSPPLTRSYGRFVRVMHAVD
jgi:hexosaminidase